MQAYILDRCYNCLRTSKDKVKFINRSMPGVYFGLSPSRKRIIVFFFGTTLTIAKQVDNEYYRLAEYGKDGKPIPSTKRNGNEERHFTAEYPKVAAQFHPVRNGNTNPDLLTHGMKTRYWWICEKGHEFQDSVQARCRGYSCPCCRQEHGGRIYKKKEGA